MKFKKLKGKNVRTIITSLIKRKESLRYCMIWAKLVRWTIIHMRKYNLRALHPEWCTDYLMFIKILRIRSPNSAPSSLLITPPRTNFQNTLPRFLSHTLRTHLQLRTLSLLQTQLDNSRLPSSWHHWMLNICLRTLRLKENRYLCWTGVTRQRDWVRFDAVTCK